MDPASLALGSAAFAFQLHEAVLGCIDAIRNFRDAGEQNALLNCKLQIEQYILARWGQRCELAEGQLGRYLPNAEDCEMVLMILRNMLGIVAETEMLRKKYGMGYVPESDASVKAQRRFGFLIEIQRKKPVDVKEGMLGVAMSTANDATSYQKLTEKGTTAMNMMRKYRWVVVDSKRFEELVRHLQDFNKSLYRLIEHSFSATAAVESDILDATPDHYLSIVEQATAESYPTVSYASNIKHTIVQSESPGGIENQGSRQRNLQIRKDQLLIRQSPSSTSQTRALATYRPAHGRPRTVLVEWRKFASGLNQYTRDSTIKRAENLARIMQKKPNKAAGEYFRILECVGYYVTDQEVGYVFDLPLGANPHQRPVSLEELLYGVDSDDYLDKPPLEQRLELCKALCNCIYWVHAGDLVHKGIRSKNIIFFKPEAGGDVRIVEPYITGFDHSRPDGPNDPTITISVITPDDDRYRHPAANTSMSRRSTKIHDMYSLGLILLEVSHWAKLKDLVEGRTGEDVKSFLLSDESPIDELDHLMGSRLQRIVQRCVSCDFQVNIEDPSSARVLREIFLYEIAAEIMKCSV